MTVVDLLVRCGFTPAQARALAAAGYGVVAWVPFGWVPAGGQ